MGILVAGLSVDHLGLTLPEAYVAVAKNAMVITPTDAGYEVTTQYCTWASHAARVAGKAPVMYAPVTCTHDSLADVYAAVYASIKEQFPGCTDVLEGPVE